MTKHENNSDKKELRHLSLAGKWEGISYLLLLFIAMPLKYFFDMPMAVSVVGSLHGALFVWFMYALFNAWNSGGLSFGRSVLVFLLSLVPFGTFRLDRFYKA